MRHFKSNEEFGYARVRENFLSIHMTVESLLGFGIMQPRHAWVQFGFNPEVFGQSKVKSVNSLRSRLTYQVP